MTETLIKPTDTELHPFDPEMLVRRGNYTVLITPEVAAELLERNLNNRKPKRRAIGMYARDMRAGNWSPDASDIKVAKTGELLDGQNRLMACVEAGVPFPTLLRTGLDKDTRNHVDQGVRRTVGDTLDMNGITDPRSVATAINLRIRYEKQVRDNAGRMRQETRVNQTHQEAADYLAEHPSLEKYATVARRMSQIAPAIPRSVFIAFLSMTSESSEHMTQAFSDAFITGESSGTGDPLLALARYAATAQKNKVGSPGVRGRYVAMKHLLAMILAWNAYIEGEQVPKIAPKDSDVLVLPI